MSDRRLPYFKFYPQDFMGSGKVQMMTPAERGIYISLLCWSWQEGPLPDDPDRLARVAGATEAVMRECWPAVRATFEVEGDGRLVHARLEKERAAASKRSKRARHAAEMRHASSEDAPSMPGAHPEHTTRSAKRGAPDLPSSEAHSLRSLDAEKPTGSGDKSPGPRPAVENSNGDTFRGRLCGEMREHGYAPDGKPPAQYDIGSDVDIGRGLVKAGYRERDVLRLPRAVRLMAEARHPAVQGWIAPGDKFTMRVLNRATEQGAKLAQVALGWIDKHDAPKREDRNGSGLTRISA